MDDFELTELICSNMKVSYIHMRTTQFDTTLFKQENPLLYNEYTKKKETRRFTIR